MFFFVYFSRCIFSSLVLHRAHVLVDAENADKRTKEFCPQTLVDISRKVTSSQGRKSIFKAGRCRPPMSQDLEAGGCNMLVRMDLSLKYSQRRNFFHFFEQKKNKIFKSRGLSRPSIYAPASSKYGFRDEISDEEVSTRRTMSRLATKFDETGSIEDELRSGRSVTVTAEESRQLVFRTFYSNPRTSQRRTSHDLHISRTSLQRRMKDLNLKPYESRLLLALNEDDPDRRLEFCEWILDSTQDDQTLLDQILWTDEAMFRTYGHVDRHNCVYSSDANPHFVIEQELSVPQVIVWGGGHGEMGWSNRFLEGSGILKK